MKIAFRCDASLQIGTGHVMRCLTLADALREKGANCTFICRLLKGHLIDLISQRGHESIALPDSNNNSRSNTNKSLPSHAGWLGVDWSIDAIETLDVVESMCVDWLVVDHYALDERWEKRMRAACKRLMVIDDLADRQHDCDLLLDQNLGHSEKDYDELTPADCIKLCGPKYALLRPEFAQLRHYSLARREKSQLKHILITMGGVDNNNVTGQVLEAMSQFELPTDLELTVVMGPHAPWLEKVQEQAVVMPVNCQVLVNVNNMAQLMADADLAIGAAGSTSWERCCLGLPTLLIVLADNQRKSAEVLKKIGAVLLLDNQKHLNRELQKNILMASNKLQELQTVCSTLTDGNGVARVIKLMLEENVR